MQKYFSRCSSSSFRAAGSLNGFKNLHRFSPAHMHVCLCLVVHQAALEWLQCLVELRVIPPYVPFFFFHFTVHNTVVVTAAAKTNQLWSIMAASPVIRAAFKKQTNKQKHILSQHLNLSTLPLTTDLMQKHSQIKNQISQIKYFPPFC